MQLARVTGSVVASVKEPRLTGTKLLLVTDTAPDGTAGRDAAYVAVDMVGAGEDELVLVVRGSTAARALDIEGVPVDAAIVAIVDAVRKGGSVTYSKD